mgnify:FL=1
MTKVINLFGGAGVGKSTLSSEIFAKLKKKGASVELVTEYAKDLVYDNNNAILDDQFVLFAEQNHRLIRLENKVDYIVTDSPLLLSFIYDKTDNFTFRRLVTRTFNEYLNINYLLRRTVDYMSNGRLQTEAEAKEFDDIIHKALDLYDIPYTEIAVDELTADTIIAGLDI